MEKLKKVLKEKSKTVNCIFISSFIPRKCGIATYTRDLIRAIDLVNPYCKTSVVAMVKPEEKIVYPPKVKFQINQCDINSYIKAAKYINRTTADIVILEHEFGLYSGEFGEYINELVKILEKQLVVTAHTIPDNPDKEYGKVLKDLINFADRIIVMMPESRKKLIKRYNYPEERIEIIPHGVPDISLDPDTRYRSKSGFKDRLVLGSINLLSENKGLEYVIEALPEIKKHIPHILYLIIGQTHPNVLRCKGEKYRTSLKEKIDKLGLHENVKFINKYVSLKELISWLMTFDIYITPYLDPHQSASGALAYAIGAGRVCISTPYSYAKEVLSEGRGIIVPFKSSQAIADAVIDISKDSRKRLEIEKKAYKYGRLMTWYNVAAQYIKVFNEVLDEYSGKSEEIRKRSVARAT